MESCSLASSGWTHRQYVSKRGRRSLVWLPSPSPQSTAAVLRDRVLVGQAGALFSLCPARICRVRCCLRPSSSGHQLCVWTPSCPGVSFEGAQILPWGNVSPLCLILPSQVCPLAKVRSANSACPPHRAGLVNYPSPFPRGATVSSVFRYWVSPALTLPFFTGCLTGPSNGVLCSPRVWN